jgi:hypothetical protein
MKALKIMFLGLVATSFIILGTTGISLSAPVTLKLAHVVSTSTPYHMGAMELARLV